MAFNRITSTLSTLGLGIDGVYWSFARTTLPASPTETQVRNAIRVACGGTLPSELTVHVNRDGSIALATGIPPAVWPEDEAAP